MTTTKNATWKRILVLVTMLVAMIPAKMAFATYESEPNDDFSNADSICMGTTVYGDIEPGCGWEYDCYKLNSPIAGTATLTFVNECPDNWSSHFSLYTYDKYYKNASLFNEYVRCDTTAPHRFTIKLNKGMNYIRISGTDNDPELRSYRFRVAYSVPKTTANASSPKKRTLKVSWAKKAQATGYQIRYSTNKSMKGAKTISVSNSKSARVFTVAKSKKTYYVQVRTVRKVGNTKYYSAWSATKVVRSK